MGYKYTAGSEKTRKLEIAQKISKDFLKVDFELANLRKEDFDMVWDISGKLLRMTRTDLEEAENGE
jgi:hypothetical protein